MAKLSAGLLLHRGAGEALEVLLVHPGGPFWARKDEGAWTIPKGEYLAGEDPLEAARREFDEELGTSPPDGPLLDLGEVRQAGGKHVVAWALRGDLDVDEITSNTFEMVWPPRSGQVQSFPEIDRAGWFTVEEARVKLLSGQLPFLDRLVALV